MKESTNQPMLRVKDVCKTFIQAQREVEVLKHLSLVVNKGEFVALMGSSGAGKSTLLQVLGCLDRPTSGHYQLDGLEVSSLNDDELARIRNQKIGFIFQTSHLVDYLDLADNVCLPGFYAQSSSAEKDRDRAMNLLKKVGLEHRSSHIPAALSGGERQRAVIARALFNEPALLLADEPTGNLDSANVDIVLGILDDLHSSGLTIILVTHDDAVAENAQQILSLTDGGIKPR